MARAATRNQSPAPVSIAAEWVKRSELKGWDRNPRKNQPVEKVARSIRRFGWGAVILARRDGGEIVAGHTRSQAIDLLKTWWEGQDPFPNLTWHPDAVRTMETDEVPVRYGEWSRDDAHELAVADNKLAEFAEWDTPLLFEELDDYEPAELEVVGFSRDDLDEMAVGLAGPPEPPPKPPPYAYTGKETATIHCGDMRAVLADMEPDSLDAIVSDPPYGLSFMGRGWDQQVPGPEYWEACLRVAKPGAHLVAFGGTRTHHRLTCAIEDAGWELRDCLMWLYGSGFPKSLDVSKAIDKAAGAERLDRKVSGPADNNVFSPSQTVIDRGTPVTQGAKQWEGWGTALKPAWEPILLARKPFMGTVAANVLEHGAGGLNIDATRISAVDQVDRWPANAVFDPVAGAMLDDQAADTARFFYTAKASKAEREAGLEGAPSQNVNDGRTTSIDNPYQRGDTLRKNLHPTVKPISLMRWLVRMVAPIGATVLDPFCGSGSTGVACALEGQDFVGVDLEQAHVDIAKGRHAHAASEAE